MFTLSQSIYLVCGGSVNPTKRQSVKMKVYPWHMDELLEKLRDTQGCENSTIYWHGKQNQ